MRCDLVNRYNRPVFARWYAFVNRRAERGELGRRRQALLAHATGRMLDLGAGTGAAFRHLPSSVSGVVAVDPDLAMVRQALVHRAETTVPVRFVRALGEQLPFADATFDTALVALVLCSVGDLDRAVAELHRVLRPGGRLLVMEHVRSADEELAAWQDRFERVWAWCNACRPNRRTVEALQSGGFQFEAFELHGFPVLPHVHAIARRS